MSTDDVPEFVRQHYEIHEWRHASAVLFKDFPEEWEDLMQVLTDFRLFASHIIVPGGRKSKVAEAIDQAFRKRGWKESKFDTRILVGDEETHSPTHQLMNTRTRSRLRSNGIIKTPSLTAI